MKKLIIVFTAAFLFIACGGGSSAKKIAEEICDCTAKANALPASDPNRMLEQNACAKKQVEGWNKVKDNAKDAAEFNQVLGKCAEEQMKKAFGK